MQWISEHSTVLSVLANIGMVVIWLTYLQIFMVGFKRQNRAVIHISRAAAEDEAARCLVTNMGSQPVYLLGLAIDLKCADDSPHRVRVTEREEFDRDAFENPLQRTLEGPLQSGESRDIGSFDEIARRAARRSGFRLSTSTIERMTITAVAASNQAQKLVGGYKSFTVERGNAEGPMHFIPATVLTPQVSGLYRTRRLQSLITDS